MKKWLNKLKSNKGFTMQDVIVAMVILALFTSTIGGCLTLIYRIQSETKITTAATSYAIKIIENIDKIGYDEVKNGMEENYKSTYSIPSKMNLIIKVDPYGTDNTVKKVELTISYEFAGKTRSLIIEKFKAKEA